MGIIFGGIFGVTFATTAQRTIRTSLTTVYIPITFGILYAAKQYYSIEPPDIFIPSLCYFVAFLISCVAVFVGICYLIKTQKTEKVRIRVLDIVIGYSKALEQYYQERKKEIENDLNVTEATRILKELKKEKDKNTYALKRLEEKRTIITQL